VLDARRHHHCVQRLEVLDLRSRSQARFTLDDYVELIRHVQRTTRLLLLRLQAQHLADHALTVEQGYAHRPLAQESAQLAEVDNLHGDS
jgi:hypothetical protein